MQLFNKQVTNFDFYCSTYIIVSVVENIILTIIVLYISNYSLIFGEEIKLMLTAF